MEEDKQPTLPQTQHQPIRPLDKRQRSFSDTEMDTEEFKTPKQARYLSPINTQAENTLLSHQLSDMKNQIIDSLKELSEEVSRNTQAVTSLVTRNDNLEEEFAKLKIENSQLTQTVAVLEAKQANTEAALKKLQDQITENQTRQMRLNLMFYGAPEYSKENALATVSDILTKKMKIPEARIKRPGFIKGDISLDIAHRVGKAGSQSQPRPIVLKLVDRHSRDEILKFTSNLKGSKISVAEQYPDRIRAERAALVPELKRQRKLGNTANIRVNKLIVNGEEVPSTESRNPVRQEARSTSTEPCTPSAFIGQ